MEHKTVRVIIQHKKTATTYMSNVTLRPEFTKNSTSTDKFKSSNVVFKVICKRNEWKYACVRGNNKRKIKHET